MSVCPAVKRTVLIRADGSKAIGMGHLSRACLVADALTERGHDVLLLVKRNVDAIRFLNSRCATPVLLPEDISLEAEFDLIRDRVRPSRGVLVMDVLNHRDYSALFGQLRRKGCASAVIFDDEGTDCIEADIALNGSPSQSAESYANCTCRYLVGPRYFIMDPRYKGAAVLPPRPPVRDVLVTLGGTDHHDLLFKLLSVFDGLDDKYCVRIASTTATGYSDRLAEVLKGASFPVQLHLDVPSLVELWATSDVAITAGGNTLFERIATRLPGATLCQLALQMKHADSFERLGVNRNLGYGPELDHDQLSAMLKRFLKDSVEHSRQYVRSLGLIDAKGLDYLVSAIEDATMGDDNELR